MRRSVLLNCCLLALFAQLWSQTAALPREFRNETFSVSYPADWKADESSAPLISLVPVTPRRAGPSPYLVGFFLLPADAVKRLPSIHDLRSASDYFISIQIAAGAGASVEDESMVTVNETSAYSVRSLYGRAGYRERIWQLTFARQDGSYFYVVCTVREEHFERIKPTFDAILGSLRITQVLASGPAPPPPTVGELRVTVTPGEAQVYLDDEPRGVTSEQGRLVLKDLKPGVHNVRVNLPGYKEAFHAVFIVAGQTYEFQAELKRKGLQPLKCEEIEEGLTNGISPARMKTLVTQIGTDCKITDATEKKLRGAGADDGLILACIEHQK